MNRGPRDGPVEGPSWAAVERVLDELLDDSTALEEGIAVDSRRLEAACGGDSVLRARVQGLLAEMTDEHDPLDEGVAQVLPDLLDELSCDEDAECPRSAERPVAGRRIDRYRLLDTLGSGGMGVVYRAERADADFDKQVALKVMPVGLESTERQRRFLLERQILARLEHDNIARLLDGGLTDDGYPYLAMELVDGLPIDRHCEEQKLSLNERLGLFLEVCGAVQFAHENLVLHRDLKPSNVLVTNAGRVKLLDFGVGKMLDDTGEGEQTRFQPMTPEYSSPEQRENRPVNTTTDVYSLGLLLRRLIAGKKPSEEGTAEEQQLPGDLRVILAKALRPSQRDRYRSVAELASDVRSFCSGRPIQARAPTLRYRLSKFVGRNLVATSIAAAAAVLLLVSMVAIVWQARSARQQRDRAIAEAQKAQSVASLLGGLFAAADPHSPSAGQLSARELLARGEQRLQRELADQPAVRRELLAIIGDAFAGVGDNQRGISLLEEAIALHRNSAPIDRLALAEALRSVATIYHGEGQIEGARLHLAEAMDLLLAADADDSQQAGLTLRELGRVETVANRHGEAEELFVRALDLLEEHGSSLDVAVTKTDLAAILERTERVEQALQLNVEALDELLLGYGEGHPMVSGTRNNIAVTQHRLGNYAAAEQLLLRAVQAEERTYGPQHAALANTLTNLGRVLMDRGRFADAAGHVERAATIRRESSPPDAYNRIAAEMNLATLQVALGDYDSAIALYRSGLERLERLTGEASAPSARVRALLGIALHRAGATAASERELRGALEFEPDGAPALHRAELRLGLGALLGDLQRADEAEGHLRTASALFLEALPNQHWKLIETRIELARALTRQPATEGTRTEIDRLLAEIEAAEFLEQPGFEWLRRRTSALLED